MAARKKPSNPPEPQEHLVQKPFAEMLAQFTTMGGESIGESFGSIPQPIIDVDFREVKTGGKKKDRPEPVDDDDGSNIAYDVMDEELSVDTLRKERAARKEADDFDYLDSFDEMVADTFKAEEDVAFRNSLISMGRKYAVKGFEESQESSEVTRAFSRQEIAIQGLLEAYDGAIMDIGRDLAFLRTMRTRSYKSIGEMAEVHASYLSGKLAAIKELNSMAKNKFDITAKLKAASGGEGDSSTAASRAIQQIFSAGRNALVTADSPGDSGAYEEDHSTGDISPGGADYNDGRVETALAQAMDIPEPSTDGDVFIMHEKEGVEYVLDIGEDGEDRQIYAINQSGDIVRDYPLPSDPQSLTFSINEMTGTATDQMQRTYRVRKAGVDMVGED